MITVHAARAFSRDGASCLLAVLLEMRVDHIRPVPKPLSRIFFLQIRLAEKNVRLHHLAAPLLAPPLE